MSFYFPDGKGGKRLITVDSAVPAASSTEKGGVIVNGNGLIMDNGTLKADYSNLPTASDTVKGVIKVGAGLKMNGDILDCIVQPETGITYTAGENVTITGNTIKAADTTYGEATTSQKGLMSTSDKLKLSGIATGAQVNVIESVKVNGTALAVSNKAVNIDLSGKVDKVNGKGLSTNDYTTAEKDKLASITVNGGNVVIDTANLVTKAELNTAVSNVTVDTSNLVVKENGKGLSTNDYTAADRQKLHSLASITATGSGLAIDSSGVISFTGDLRGASSGATGGAGKEINLKGGEGSIKGGTGGIIYISGASVSGSASTQTGGAGGTIFGGGGQASASSGSTAIGGNGGVIVLKGGEKNGAAGSRRGNGGTIHMEGNKGGIIALNGDSIGGEIDLSANYAGGTILAGSNGTGGVIDLYGYERGGRIDLGTSSSGQGGSITGDIYFTDTPTFKNGANGLTTDGLYIPTTAYNNIMANFATVTAS